jgi:hypothetical protein
MLAKLLALLEAGEADKFARTFTTLVANIGHLRATE